MNSLRGWIKAIRVPVLSATVVPVALGTAIAWSETGAFHPSLFGLALVAAGCIQAGTNMVNDYFDHQSGTDASNKTFTLFSGGSRVIQDGLLTPTQIIRGAGFAYALSALIGLYLSWVIGGIFLILLGLFGVGVGIMYTAGPVALSYRGHGLGELVVALGFGPLMVTGAYYVQTNALSISSIVASIPIAILIALVLLINSVPDYDSDLEAGKATLVVVLGKRQAARLYLALLFFAYLYTLILVALGALPPLAMVTFLTLPLAYKAAASIRGNFETIHDLVPPSAATIAIHISFGLLLVLAFVI